MPILGVITAVITAFGEEESRRADDIVQACSLIPLTALKPPCVTFGIWNAEIRCGTQPAVKKPCELDDVDEPC